MAVTSNKITEEKNEQLVKRLKELAEEVERQKELHIKAKKQKKNSTIPKVAMEKAQAELDRLRKEQMNVEGTEQSSAGEQTEPLEKLSKLEILQWKRLQLEQEEADLLTAGSDEPQEKPDEEESLYVSDNDSGYESDVVIAVEASGSLIGTTPSDGKDLYFTKRGRAYYIIYQRGPNHGNRVYEARKASLSTCKELRLNRLVTQRPDPGTFQLTGIQGVVVAPGCDYQVLLRKNWKIEDKAGVPAPKYPWFQVKIQYTKNEVFNKDGKPKKDTAFFSRSGLGNIFPDGDGILTLDKDLCLNGEVILKKDTQIPKMDLAILRAYIRNQEDFGTPSRRSQSSRSPTVQRYDTPALEATRVEEASSASAKGKNAKTVAFAAPASRNSSPLGAAESTKAMDEDYADFLAWRKARNAAQGGPRVHADMVANTAATIGKRVPVIEDVEEEL